MQATPRGVYVSTGNSQAWSTMGLQFFRHVLYGSSITFGPKKFWDQVDALSSSTHSSDSSSTVLLFGRTHCPAGEPIPLGCTSAFECTPGPQVGLGRCFVESGIHMTAMGFPAEYCTAAKQSMLTVNGSNVVADLCTFWMKVFVLKYSGWCQH